MKRYLLNCQMTMMLLALAAATPGALSARDQDPGLPGWTEWPEDFEPELPRASRAVLTVGPEGNCTHTTLQAALAAAADGDEIRLRTAAYTPPFSGGFQIWSKGLTIRGGYPDCNPGSTPTQRSVLDGNNGGLVLDILYSAPMGGAFRHVVLENLIIENGAGTDPLLSGGALVEGRPGRLRVDFINVEIADNSRSGANNHGGGLHIRTTGDRDGTQPFVTLDNASSLLNNTATGDGGGVYCESSHDTDGATLLRMGTTLVFGNQATNGGGLALNGCRNVFLYNGGPTFLFIPTGGFVLNQASGSGGAFHVDNGGQASLRAMAFSGFGNASEAALLQGNDANFGGAATVRGAGSQLVVEDAYVIGNSAVLFNGAFSVDTGAELIVRRADFTLGCQPPSAAGGVLTRPPCSVIEANEAARVGAIGATTGAQVSISRTYIRNNTETTAEQAAAIRATGVATFPRTAVNVESSLIVGNQGDQALKVSGIADLDLRYSTLADNAGRAALIDAPGGQTANLRLLSSIVLSDLANNMVASSGAGVRNVISDCVLGLHEPSATGITSASQWYLQQDPRFIDPPGGDYRLDPLSPAIDFCDGFFPPSGPDLNGGPRGVVWNGPTTIPNYALGPYDLGAFEMSFSPQPTDIEIEIISDNLFINADQSSLAKQVVVRNVGPNIAFAEIDLFDQFTPGFVTSRFWQCQVAAGPAWCSVWFGLGDFNLWVGPLMPGEVALIGATADLVNPNVDQEFLYIAGANESVHNIDTNPSNNIAEVSFRTGIFADGFEAPAGFLGPLGAGED